MFAGMGEEEVSEYGDKKDSVLFLIDCHHSMFKQNLNNG